MWKIIKRMYKKYLINCLYYDLENTPFTDANSLDRRYQIITDIAHLELDLRKL